MGGPINAEVVIITDFPNVDAVHMKRPMVGASGRFLWTCLEKENINRTNTYVTTVSKRKLLPVKGNLHKALSYDELWAWYNLLKWELAQLPNIKLVLALGALPLEALTGETGINKWRGSVIHSSIINKEGVSVPVPVLVGNNPSIVSKQPREELMYRFTMHKAGLLLQGKYEQEAINAIINPTFLDATQYIERMHDESRGDLGKPIAFDIECIANETACIGIGNSETEGMCINFRDLKSNRYSVREDVSLYRSFQKLFADTHARFIAQNGNFDAYWLWYKDRIHVHKSWFDTLLAHHTLYPTLPHNLGALTAQYTKHPYYKDEGKTWKEGGDIDGFWTYNVKDVCITWDIHAKILRELQKAGLDEFFFSHVMRLQPHLSRITVNGVKSDLVLKEQITQETAASVATLLAKFHKQAQLLVHDPEYMPNPASPKQMQSFYFTKLGLVGRGLSTDENNRARMASNPRISDEVRDMFITVNELAGEQKFLGTYAKSRLDEDGRFRCEYKQYGTQEAPGRLSSASVLWGTGGNLQNQPERAKGMFIADPGYSFAYFDLSQAEARFVAWDAEIDTWIEQFERARIDASYDCHRALAADLWNLPYDEIPKEDRDEDNVPTLRYIAKRCRHGLNYRMKAPMLQQQTGLPMHKAVEAYNIYHEKTPELELWWGALTREAITNKYLTTPFGRRLPILEHVTDEALKSIVAFRPQSSIGDKVSQVIYQSHDDSGWPASASIILNVHDALISHQPIGLERHCLRIMRKYAESPIIIKGKPLIIPADCAISVEGEDGKHRWSQLHKLTRDEVME